MHNEEKYGNFVEIAVLQQKLLLYSSETKLNSIVIIALTQVMNNIVSVLMSTGNKVYLNHGVAEGQNLKLIRIVFFFLCRIMKFLTSGAGSDMNPAHPDTSMKLGRYVHKHELFEIFSLANQN